MYLSRLAVSEDNSQNSNEVYQSAHFSVTVKCKTCRRAIIVVKVAAAARRVTAAAKHDVCGRSLGATTAAMSTVRLSSPS